MKAFRWNKSNYISSQGLTSLGWLWPGHLESGSPGACLAPAHPSCQQPQKRWCHDNHPGDGWDLNRSYTFIYIIETYHGWHMGYSIYIYMGYTQVFFDHIQYEGFHFIVSGSSNMFSCSLHAPCMSVMTQAYMDQPWFWSIICFEILFPCMHVGWNRNNLVHHLWQHTSWAELLPCHISMPSVLLYAWDLALSAWFGSHINCELEGMTGSILFGGNDDWETPNK